MSATYAYERDMGCMYISCGVHIKRQPTDSRHVSLINAECENK